MYNKAIVSFLAFLFFLPAFSQKITRVTGTYKMKIESHMSEMQARQFALKQAQIEAMKDAFGTRIGMMNQTRMETTNGKTNTSFSSVANSLVKGIWLKDLKEPEIRIINQGDERWIVVDVEGRARNLDKAGVQFEAKPLKCAENLACAGQEFREGEQIYLYFRSPEDGYLSVYIDDQTNCQMLLPYQSMNSRTLKVERDKEYILFSSNPKFNYTGNIGDVDEYIMNTNFDYEVDLLYVVFSTEDYSRTTLDSKAGYPKYTSSSNFREWLGEVMSYENMYLEVIDISISK
ncbi:MAG: DUF4384 domain-containing protein [Cyclobacteriaceae bacterium]|nr:DUF4384 domain-containing protein [Cyclobacteriaceae bacterium]